MKTWCAVLASFSAFRLGTAAILAEGASPVDSVVKLLTNLRGGIVADGQEEQRSYDKSACWCEDTMERKANDIAAGKKEAEELQTLILKLEGESATHGAEVENLEKAVAANLASQKEATETRGATHVDFQDQKTESEQAVGALEAAIGAITGSGASKKGKFLEAGAIQEARLLSVAAGIRPVLERSTHALSDADLRTAQHFAAHPEDFVHFARPRQVGEVSAIEVSNNPFGDYAPQSTQIQGILKGLYGTFASSLEKSNAEEAQDQKSHDELMATKQAEAASLQATLTQHSLDKALKEKELAEAKVSRDATLAEVKANEAFFSETKDSCKGRARQWSERSRLRSEELQGIQKAVEILSGPEARAVFGNATTALLELKEVHGTVRESGLTIALRVAAGIRAHATAKVATAAAVLELKIKAASGGHFDEVLAAIGEMMEVLRKEEQDDIAHRDRCEGSTNKNGNEQEDLEHSIGNLNSSVGRMERRADQLGERSQQKDEELAATNKSLVEVLKMRNKEHKEFVKALKDDKLAVALLDQAIVALGAFYKQNKIESPKAFIQLQRQEPEYSVDKDKAPDLEWSGEYQGKRGESSPVLSLLTTIKQDLEKEMVTGREDEAAAQAAFEKERGAMRESYLAQEKEIAETQTEWAEVKTKIADTSAERSVHEAELKEHQAMAEDLVGDCAWVKSEFQKRRTARKAEIDGLVEAKDYLAGVESGD